MSPAQKVRLLLAVTLLSLALHATAEKDPFLPGGARTLHLTGILTKDTVTISWPQIPGNWELMCQQPADTGEWQPIDSSLYQTNAATVSVTQPLPAQGAQYRLRRAFPKISIRPPMPTIPTNRMIRPPGTHAN